MTMREQIAKRADDLQLREAALNLLALAPVSLGWLAGFVARVTLLGVAAVLYGWNSGLGPKEE